MFFRTGDGRKMDLSRSSVRRGQSQFSRRKRDSARQRYGAPRELRQSSVNGYDSFFTFITTPGVEIFSRP